MIYLVLYCEETQVSSNLLSLVVSVLMFFHVLAGLLFKLEAIIYTRLQLLSLFDSMPSLMLRSRPVQGFELLASFKLQYQL